MNDKLELLTIWEEARGHIETYRYIIIRHHDDDVAVEYASAYLGDFSDCSRWEETKRLQAF